jgi:hypothetical protein
VTDWASRFREPAWPHQVEEFEAHRDAKVRALHWQPRTGKSKAMVDLACYLYEQGKIDAVLVLAPMNVHANWQRNQIFRHTWEGVDSRAFTWSSTDRRTDPKAYDRAFGGLLAHEGLAWFAVNAEATTLAVAKPFLSAFVRRRRILLVVDETHEWRRPSSKRSSYARGLARKVAYVRCLSGTMVDNSPFHAWAQYELLAPAALGYKDYGDFERHFGIWEKRQIKVKGGRTRLVPACTGYRNQDELRERMARWTSYVHRCDVPGLPPLVNSRTEFELTAAQRRVYNDLVKGAIVKLDNGEYMGEAEGAVLITRLQQAASGFAVDEDGAVVDLVKDEENPRLLALEAELALVGRKTVIYCRYREDVVRVMAACRRWGYKPVDYYGGTPKALRGDHERLFQEDESVGPLVGNVKACGAGLEFSRGTDIIWYSHTHGDLIGRRQGDERCTKVGGESVGVCDFIALGTVDERMIRDQEEKIDVTEYLTGDGLRRYLELLR